MDRLDKIRTFVAVARHGSFVRAARALGLSTSMVSKRLAELEIDLRVPLLLRTTRQIRLSDYGERYFHRAAELLQQLDQLDHDVAQRDDIGGAIRIAAPTTLGIYHVGPALERFRQQHVQVRIELVLFDRVVDPVEEGLDLVLAEQPSALSRDDLTEETLCPIERVVCATPAYLARRGTPLHPRELARHDCIHNSFLPSGPTWLFGAAGAEIAVPIRPVFSTSNGLIMRSVALHDGGVMLLPRHMVEADLASGRLCPILADYSVPQYSLLAITPPLSRIARRVQMLLQHLRDEFRPPPWARAMPQPYAPAA